MVESSRSTDDQPIEAERFSGVIRPLCEGDIAQLRPILETWTRNIITHEVMHEEVEGNITTMQESINAQNGRAYFVAESEGRVIGVMGLANPREGMQPFIDSDNPVELVNAYVDKDQRGGKGVGRALVHALEDEAIRRGHTEIILNSGPRYKRTGWGFYDRLEGFERVGVAQNLYGKGIDAPVWRKELPHRPH